MEIAEKKRRDEEDYKVHIINFQEKEDVKELDDSNRNQWIISYYDRNRLKFDLVTCILVLYDCFMVPFKNSFGLHVFDQKVEFCLNILDICIKLIFGIDLLLGFFKSFLNSKTGHEVKDRKLIAIRYLKFYFWVDFISAFPFDLFIDNSLIRSL